MFKSVRAQSFFFFAAQYHVTVINLKNSRKEKNKNHNNFDL